MTFFRNLTSQMHLSADVDRFVKEQITKILVADAVADRVDSDYSAVCH